VTLATKRILTGIHWLIKSGEAYICQSPGGWIVVRIWEKYLKSFKEVPLGDFKILVPAPAENYLRASYGADWSVPKIHGSASVVMRDNLK